VERILNQLEQEGTIDETRYGQPVFIDLKSGQWKGSVESLEGFVELFELHAVRKGIMIHVEQFKQFNNKLKYSMPISQADVDGVRTELAGLRKEVLEMTVNYANELTSDYSLKIHIEEEIGATT